MNRILLFWHKESRTIDSRSSRRRYLSIVDAVVAGEGNGPMDPDPREFGVVLAGTNPAAVDAVAAVLMGFDPELIPTVRNAFAPNDLPIATGSWKSVCVRSNVPDWACQLGDIRADEVFRPHFGWRGHIERQSPVVAKR